MMTYEEKLEVINKVIENCDRVKAVMESLGIDFIVNEDANENRG